MSHDIIIEAYLIGKRIMRVHFNVWTEGVGIVWIEDGEDKWIILQDIYNINPAEW